MFSFDSASAAKSDLDLKYNLSAAQATRPPNHLSTTLTTKFTTHEARNKNSCYQCYKLFYADKALQFRDKKFCTQTCIRSFSLALVKREENAKQAKDAAQSRPVTGVVKNDNSTEKVDVETVEKQPVENSNISAASSEPVVISITATTSVPLKTPTTPVVNNENSNELSNQIDRPSKAVESKKEVVPASVVEWQSSMVIRPSTPLMARAPVSSQPIIEFPDDD